MGKEDAVQMLDLNRGKGVRITPKIPKVLGSARVVSPDGVWLSFRL